MSKLLLLSLIFLTACASYRKIGRPNYDLRHEAARQEIDQFTIWAKPLSSLSSSFEFGPRGRQVSYPDSAPLIKEVSPESQPYLERFDKWQTPKWLALSFAGVAYFLSTINPNEVQKYQMQILAGISGAYGLSLHLYQIHQLRKIPPIYNRQLYERYFPTLNWSSSF